MANNVSQWERERFSYGDAPGDKKGDPIRTHAMKAERTDGIIFSWLSGGSSETTLPQALPVSRGGTGSTTVAGTLRNLGYFEDVNHTLRRGIKAITVSNVAAVDNFKNITELLWSHSDVGTYTLKGALPSSDLWGVVVPTDYLGVPKYVVELNTVGDTTTVLVYTAVLSNGAYVKGVLTDIVNKYYINIEVK